MKKAEIKILMNEYKSILEAEVLGYNKEIEKNLMERLIIKLDAKKEMYETINTFLIESKNYDVIATDLFNMINESFIKYNTFIKYDISDIEEKYEEIQYHMNEEENKYYNIRINQLKNRLKY